MCRSGNSPELVYSYAQAPGFGILVMTPNVYGRLCTSESMDS